jgi:thiosulfate/3-mercaptopyruvate sulfurtransferase
VADRLLDRALRGGKALSTSGDPSASGPLITALALARALSRERPSVLDVRWTLGGPPGIDAYQAGHIPGAVFVDLECELSGPPGSAGRHPLPEAERFAAAMRAKGVSAGRPVVVYDGGGGGSAARAWWLLRYFGHRRVAVLDGGLPAWQAAGLPVSAEVSPVRAGDFQATPGGMPVLDAAGAAHIAAEGVLLDARAPERFRGEREPVDPIAGHIPGARNHPVSATVDADGRFLAPAQLASTLQHLGVQPGAAVGAYCGSGVSAAQLVLAAELAGCRAALYPGSWSEWICDSARPVAVGE